MYCQALQVWGLRPVLAFVIAFALGLGLASWTWRGGTVFAARETAARGMTSEQVGATP